MKCPKCQNDNYEGARFCTHCGFVLPRESRAKKFFMALLHAFLYVALFMGIQTVITFMYSFALSFSLVGSILFSGNLDAYDAELITEQLMNHVYENLHTVMLIAGLVTVLALPSPSVSAIRTR